MAEIMAYRCKKCGKMAFPKRVVCLRCKGREFETSPLDKECTLITFTQIYQLPWGINDLFITIGICQFPNGVRVMGRITTPDVRIGMRMKAQWKCFRQMEGEDVWGWVFEPME